jgi:hypothetical protein
MNRAEIESLGEWARAESLRLARDWPMGSPLETQVLESWKVHRPTMLKVLGGAAESLAH